MKFLPYRVLVLVEGCCGELFGDGGGSLCCMSRYDLRSYLVKVDGWKGGGPTGGNSMEEGGFEDWG